MEEIKKQRKPTWPNHQELKKNTITEKKKKIQTTPKTDPMNLHHLKENPSWSVLKDIIPFQNQTLRCENGDKKKYKRIGCSGSLCNLRDNTKVMHRPDQTSPPDSSHKRVHNPKKKEVPLGLGKSSSSSSNSNGCSSNNSTSDVSRKVVVKKGHGDHVRSGFSCSSGPSYVNNGGLRSIPLRKLSGCYECHSVVDPVNGISRYASLSSISVCPHCGEIFVKAESLELHQALKHAVSELGPEDSSRNIVEIIFQSSWLKKESPICNIDRILKVHNSQKTINKFEDYRDSVKVKANKLAKKHARCIADGNELLRFLCTSFVCSLGLNGTSNLCNSIANCGVCNIIKNGFKIEGGGGICTTASSGKAHDYAKTKVNEKRAMLVCRVIAGRVKKSTTQEGAGEEATTPSPCSGYDSVAGQTAVYSNLDELFVFNPRAILPCFVVIYRVVS